MKNKKKTFMLFAAVVVLMAALIAVVNLVDAGTPVMNAAPSADASSAESFAASIAGPQDFEKENGFYGLWTLTEPDDADIHSDTILTKYRGLQDPSTNMKNNRENWKKDPVNWSANKERYPYKTHADTRKRLIETGGDFDSYFTSFPQDWVQLIRAQRPALNELKTNFSVPLARYERVVNSPSFSEFTEISIDAPIPNLLAWLHVAKAYNAVQIACALDGDWSGAVANLLKHVDFGKRAVKTSRTLIVNLVGKAVARETLMALVCLMNQPEFPTEIYSAISRGLPPIKPEEYGARLPLLLEGVFYAHSVNPGGLWFQINRTRQYFYDFYSRLADLEITPPHQWNHHPSEMNVKTGFFWFLQNARGKTAFMDYIGSKDSTNLYAVVFKSYNLRTTYEMTQISAEVHSLCRSGKSIGQAFRESPLYRELPDPCSGEAYRWHPEKQVLYSLGTDRDDDGGELRLKDDNTDNPIPLIVYVNTNGETK